jgi:multisubunit Na+/H+ antiporter MnhF subunit
VNAFTIAATLLLAGFVPLLLVCAREPALDGLIALELGGALTTTVLLCLAEGLGSSAMFGVPVVCATVTWVGGLVYARFMGRHV